MKVASTHQYAAPPDVVFAMMTTPEVLTEKYTALGHHDVHILEHSDDGGEVSVRSRRNVPMEVPGFAKKFLSPTNSVEQRDRWHAAAHDGSRSGTWEVQAKGVPVSAGGTESVLVRLPDGREQTRERPRPPQLLPLLAALDEVAEYGPGEYEGARERAVLGALDLKLGAIEAGQRQREAQNLVRDYARKAALGALAAVAPGSDLVIQGVLATRLLSELCAIYQVPLKSIDLDQFVQLAGGRLRGSAALILAIAGNAMKAFPGLGTVGGGLVHAVAYAMIFDSLGRAVADTLARGDGFDRKAALARFDAGLADRSRLIELAPDMLKLVLASRGEKGGES